jgi:ATP/maltotriose-dependent transcriptional regulator MalT
VSATFDRLQWPLCGRVEELDFIAKALAGPRTKGVVLHGLAGVGKTRLAGEALRRARDQGLATASATATATTADIPLGALAPLLPAECAAARDRFTMLNVGCRSLAAYGKGRTLVLAVDDAHLLDPLGGELVRQAVTGSSVLLVATVRRGEVVPEPLSVLWKDGVVDRLEVAGLSRTETEELVTSVLGGPVVGSTLQQLWDATQGNVLFLREIVESARRGGDLEQHGGVWWIRRPMVPGAALIDLVEQRLGQLSTGEEAVLERVAFAEPVDVGVLQRMVSSSDVEALERRGLVEVHSEADRLRARLAHPLYAEAVRARTPPLRKQRIFTDLAEAFDSTDHATVIDALRVATWRLDSGSRCSPELLLDACRHARLVFDYALAERFARAAVERGGGFQAHRAVGECLYAQGRFAEADEQLRPLAAIAVGDEEHAQWTVSHAANLMWGLGREAEAEAVLSAAAESVHDPAMIDEITSLRSRLVFAAGRVEETIAAASNVLAKRDSATDWAVLSAAAALAPALALNGHCEKALATVDEHLGLALAHHADRPDALGMLLVSGGTAHWLAGNLAAAAEQAERLYEFAMSIGAQEGICAGARNRGWAALAAGQPRTALRWIHEAVAAVPEGDVNGLACWCLTLLAESAAVSGDPGASEFLRQAEAARRPAIRVYDGQLALARAWVAAVAGDPSEAVAIVVSAAHDAAALGSHATEVHVLHAAVRFGYPEAVRHRLGELADMVDGRWAPAFAAHAAALADRDGQGLEDVALAFEDIGALLLAAEAAAGATQVFRDHGSGAKSRMAAARTRALAHSCEGARTPALFAVEAPAPLTRREREIGMLAAQGLSSPEIAQRLVVSDRTVEGHLYRLYAKLGVTSREQLAALFARNTKNA